MQSAVSKLGDDFKMPHEMQWELERVVSMIYGCNARSISAARHELFCSSQCTERQPPSAADALAQHFKRACYQATLWKRSGIDAVNAPSPDGHG